MMKKRLFLVLWLGAAVGLWAEKAPDFRLLDDSGRSFSLHRQLLSKAVVILVAGDEKSLPHEQLKLWSDIQSRFDDKPVQFWILNAATETTPGFVKAVREAGVKSPILQDKMLLVSREIGSKRA